MTLAASLKTLAGNIRGIPGALGIYVHSVSLFTSSYSGTHTGDGTRTDTTTPLLESGQNPKVAWLSDEDIAVGSLSSGTIEIGPITSDHDAVSRIALIRGDTLADGDTRYVLVTGPKHPNGAEYKITDVRSHKAIHYILRAEPAEALQ